MMNLKYSTLLAVAVLSSAATPLQAASLLGDQLSIDVANTSGVLDSSGSFFVVEGEGDSYQYLDHFRINVEDTRIEISYLERQIDSLNTVRWTNDFTLVIGGLNDLSALVNPVEQLEVSTNMGNWNQQQGLHFSDSSLYIFWDQAVFGSSYQAIGDSYFNIQLPVGQVSPPPIPVPAAAWLFASALLSLAGLRRLKRS